MGVNSLPKTVTRQRRGCDLNPGPSVPDSSMLITQLPSHPRRDMTPKSAPSRGGDLSPHLLRGSFPLPL